MWSSYRSGTQIKTVKFCSEPAMRSRCSVSVLVVRKQNRGRDQTRGLVGCVAVLTFLKSGDRFPTNFSSGTSEPKSFRVAHTFRQ